MVTFTEIGLILKFGYLYRDRPGGLLNWDLQVNYYHKVVNFTEIGQEVLLNWDIQVNYYHKVVNFTEIGLEVLLNWDLQVNYYHKVVNFTEIGQEAY